MNSHDNEGRRWRAGSSKISSFADKRRRNLSLNRRVRRQSSLFPAEAELIARLEAVGWRFLDWRLPEG
jgi:hypothetical protein